MRDAGDPRKAAGFYMGLEASTRPACETPEILPGRRARGGVVRRFNEWDQNGVLRLASLVIYFFAWSGLYTASPQKARPPRPFVLHSFFILFSKNAMMLAFICVWKAFRLNCP